MQASAVIAERNALKVPAFQIQQVEHEVDDVFGGGAVEGILQRVELRQPIVPQYRYLAIQPCGLDGEHGDFARKALHLRCPVVAIAGVEARRATLTSRQDAIAVKLDLVHPSVARRRGAYQGSELRRESIRHGIT